MQALVIVAHYLEAADLAFLIRTCKEASYLKSDRYWRPLIQERFPGHPGRRAYKRYCIKANYKLHCQYQGRRTKDLIWVLDAMPSYILRQRPLWCCVCCQPATCWIKKRPVCNKESCQTSPFPDVHTQTDWRRWWQAFRHAKVSDKSVVELLYRQTNRNWVHIKHKLDRQFEHQSGLRWQKRKAKRFQLANTNQYSNEKRQSATHQPRTHLQKGN